MPKQDKSPKKELEPTRKHLLIKPDIYLMLEEMASKTVRNHTDMINFCIREYYEKLFNKKP